jgi:transcriptional regulator
MYIPPAFNMTDSKKIDSFISQNSFATVITHADDAPFANHLPLLLDAASRRLLGYMAIGNPQWKHFENGREVLSIFHGPHAYISPRWYGTKLAVPTWNYAAVHVYGEPRIISDPVDLIEIIRQTVQFYEGDEPGAWRGDLPAEFQERLLKGIVGFEISIKRAEAKYKLGQNRDKSDVASVHAALSQSPQASDRSLADFMKGEGLVE